MCNVTYVHTQIFFFEIRIELESIEILFVLCVLVKTKKTLLEQWLQIFRRQSKLLPWKSFLTKEI